LTVKGNQLLVPDFRNNKFVTYELPNCNILSKIDIPMPHGSAVGQNEKIFICTYKENSIFIMENNFVTCKENSLLDYPVSIAIKDNYTLIANWGKGDSGNLIISDDGLNSFSLFTYEWMGSKPHAVRINKQDEILVIYRNSPSLVIYDISGNIKKQKIFLDGFDPLSIYEYKSYFLIPNYIDGQIYIFDNALNNLDHFFGGGHYPTNLSIWKDSLFICEEKANRILYIDLKNIDNLLNKY